MVTLVKQQRHCANLEFRVLGQTLKGEVHNGLVILKVDNNRIERALIRQHKFKKASVEIVASSPAPAPKPVQKEKAEETEAPKRRRRRKKEE